MIGKIFSASFGLLACLAFVFVSQWAIVESGASLLKSLPIIVGWLAIVALLFVHKWGRNSFHSNRSVQLTLLISSGVLVTLFSCCSWIYPNNPWDDSNVFMTIGKSMKHGMLLYRDVFDQKGVFLFLIHQLACYVSEYSFLGIYLFEIICFWGYLVFSYRIMRLFTDNPIALPLTIFLGILFIASDFFWYGDSVEEFCLPVLSYSLYHILRYAKSGVVPKSWQAFFIGFGAGVIFWMKFTLLAFYAGALIGVLIVAYRKKQLELLRLPMLLVSAGLLSATLIAFAYFIYHGTLADMIDAYFYTNLFLYHGVASNGEPAGLWFKFVKLAICGVLIFPVVMTRVRWDVKLIVLFAYSFQVFSYTFFTLHLYYFIPLFVYSPLVVYFLRHHRATSATYIVMSGVATFSVITNFNIVSYMSGRFQDTINECAMVINADSSKSKRVLTFCSRDTGIYLLTDHLPTNRHFFVPNVMIPEIREEQAQTIAKGDVKYLIRKDDNNRSIIPFYETEVPLSYDLIFQRQEMFRHRFLTNPLMFLWNLGYTQPILKFFMTPEREFQNLLLYRRR